MHSRVQADSVLDRRVAAHPGTRGSVARRAAAPQIASSRAIQPDTPTNSIPARIKPFSPEWREHEDALDNRLRKRMNICNGC